MLSVPYYSILPEQRATHQQPSGRMQQVAENGNLARLDLARLLYLPQGLRFFFVDGRFFELPVKFRRQVSPPWQKLAELRPLPVRPSRTHRCVRRSRSAQFLHALDSRRGIHVAVLPCKRLCQLCCGVHHPAHRERVTFSPVPLLPTMARASR